MNDDPRARLDPVLRADKYAAANRVLHRLAAISGVLPDAISRIRAYAPMRSFYIWAMFKLIGYSSVETAEALGLKSHSSVSNHAVKVSRWIREGERIKLPTGKTVGAKYIVDQCVIAINNPSVPIASERVALSQGALQCSN